jgi:hypothetical protein
MIVRVMCQIVSICHLASQHADNSLQNLPFLYPPGSVTLPGCGASRFPMLQLPEINEMCASGNSHYIAT